MSKPTPGGNSPFRINLEQQKKRAKELLKGLKANDSDCLFRFKNHHPQQFDDAELLHAKLNDAQLVIAREHGLPSWTKLKDHVMSMQRAYDEINNQDSIIDNTSKTLHIRCGSDIKQTLEVAGLRGDFLEYSDPICQGPVPNDPDIFAIRTDFLNNYCELANMTINSSTKLQAEIDGLNNAARQYDRVVLWFEHDTYDQLLLARLLAFFKQHRKPNILELVTINHFPGSIKFSGLGQLPPEAIRLLWKDRKTVTKQQLKLGERTWNALRESTPTALVTIMNDENTKALPDLSNAIKRHLQELPSTTNGLGLTERLSLEILQDTPQTAGQTFRKLNTEKEPMPWLGDIMFWYIIKSMAKTTEPLFTIDKNNDGQWVKSILTITDSGRRVLDAELDWLSVSTQTRWLGGIEISPKHPCWRWDEKNGKPILTN